MIKVPDGKFIMSVDLWRTTEQGSLTKLFGEQVRVTINDGRIHEWKVCLTPRWYIEDPQGIRLSRGFTFVETAEQLLSLSSDLPYSWRL